MGGCNGWDTDLFVGKPQVDSISLDIIYGRWRIQAERRQRKTACAPQVTSVTKAWTPPVACVAHGVTVAGQCANSPACSWMRAKVGALNALVAKTDEYPRGEVCGAFRANLDTALQLSVPSRGSGLSAWWDIQRFLADTLAVFNVWPEFMQDRSSRMTNALSSSMASMETFSPSEQLMNFVALRPSSQKVCTKQDLHYEPDLEKGTQQFAAWSSQT